MHTKNMKFFKMSPIHLEHRVDRQDYDEFLNTLDEEEKAFLNSDKNYYELQFSNVGGLVMPIILEFTYTDGTQEIVRIPAEIWKRNNEKIKKVFILDKELVNVKLDPFLETADVDLCERKCQVQIGTSYEIQ